jgi:hypothetical protein
VTNINSTVLTADVLKARVLTARVLTARVLKAEPWLGAFSPRFGYLGTSVPGAGSGTGPCVVVRSLPRVRDRVVIAVPAPQSAPMAQLGQPNNYNHMTGVYAFGAGAPGPPPDREPA